MAINYGPRWNIVESFNATVTTPTPMLRISISSGGGDYGGTYDHTVSCKGVQLYSGGANRSYRVSSYRWNGSSAYTLISSAAYDVYGSTVDATAMNTFLTNMATGDLLVMTTYDEPDNNKSFFSANLRDNFGSKLITNTWEFRSVYLFVSIKGKINPIYERYEGRYHPAISATLWLN